MARRKQKFDFGWCPETPKMCYQITKGGAFNIFREARKKPGAVLRRACQRPDGILHVKIGKRGWVEVRCRYALRGR